MAITDDMLISEHAHACLGGVQRLYRLPNGFGLSLINSPMARPYPFAWEAAVLSGMDENGKADGLSYDTPLTSDTEVFATDEEANAFIAKAKAWAEGRS